MFELFINQNPVETDGTIISKMQDFFVVKLTDGKEITAHLSKRILFCAKTKIDIEDKVKVELSPYNLQIGRITHKYGL